MYYDSIKQLCARLLQSNDGYRKNVKEEVLIEAAVDNVDNIDRFEYYDAIDRLCEENILTPISNKKRETIAKSYWINGKVRTKSFDEEHYELISSYMLSGMSYYKTHKKEYRDYKKEIDIIYSYYKEKDKPRYTANELAFYLFGDEKAFMKEDKKRKEGRCIKLLSHMGLDEENLNFYYPKEGFISYTRETFYKKERRTIIIVENKDTYETMKEYMKSEYDMIIFGEGNKITGSFTYASWYGISENDVILYFGDIDEEGFNIYMSLKRMYENYNIELFYDMYEILLSTYKDMPVKRKARECVKGNAAEVIEMFDKSVQGKLKYIFENDDYIPQEAIGIYLKGKENIHGQI